MLRVMFVFPLMMIACVMLSTQPASAECAENIEKAKQAQRDSNSDTRARRAFENIIARAEKARQAGQEKKCENLVKAALSKL